MLCSGSETIFVSTWRPTWRLPLMTCEQHRLAQQEAECGCAVPEPTEKTGPSFFPASEHSWKPPPPLARGTSADADGVEAAIEIEASTWDVCVFIGAPCIGRAGSVFLSLLFLINIAAQSIFLYGIMSPELGMTSPKYSTHAVEKMREWRETLGHDYKYYSHVTGKTIVARVCEIDRSLNYGSDQVQTIGNLQGYLGKSFDGTGLCIGALMCTIALTVWLLTIVR